MKNFTTTISQDNLLFDMHGILNKIYENGEPAAKRYGLKTLFDIQTVFDLWEKITTEGKAETISSTAAKFYGKHKFTVTEKEIGYLISI